MANRFVVVMPSFDREGESVVYDEAAGSATEAVRQAMELATGRPHTGAPLEVRLVPLDRLMWCERLAYEAYVSALGIKLIVADIGPVGPVGTLVS